MARVLITGGAGFIGSHIVDAVIAAGNEPIVVDNMSSGSPRNVAAGVKIYEVDICNNESLCKVFDEARPDIVCHQAAQVSVSRSVRDPGLDAKINVMGLLNVCESAVRVGAQRIVFASSGGVMYGDVTVPADESVPANPISPYGITKLAGEKYLQFYAREYGLTCVALRYSNVYGPRQNPHGEAGVVAIFCERMLKGEAVTVNGDGKYDRDYVFGPEVARANVAAMSASIPTGYQAINIGTGATTDVNQLVAQLAVKIQTIHDQNKTGLKIPAAQFGPPRAGDLRSNVIDAKYAGLLLGWKPEISIAEGLGRTAEWFAAKS